MRRPRTGRGPHPAPAEVRPSSRPPGRAAEARFPAYTPEERLRLHALAEPLSARLGTPVRAETREVTAVWFVRAS